MRVLDPETVKNDLKAFQDLDKETAFAKLQQYTRDLIVIERKEILSNLLPEGPTSLPIIRQATADELIPPAPGHLREIEMSIAYQRSTQALVQSVNDIMDGMQNIAENVFEYQADNFGASAISSVLTISGVPPLVAAPIADATWDIYKCMIRREPLKSETLQYYSQMIQNFERNYFSSDRNADPYEARSLLSQTIAYEISHAANQVLTQSTNGLIAMVDCFIQHMESKTLEITYASLFKQFTSILPYAKEAEPLFNFLANQAANLAVEQLDDQIAEGNLQADMRNFYEAKRNELNTEESHDFIEAHDAMVRKSSIVPESPWYSKMTSWFDLSSTSNYVKSQSVEINPKSRRDPLAPEKYDPHFSAGDLTYQPDPNDKEISFIPPRDTREERAWVRERHAAALYREEHPLRDPPKKNFIEKFFDKLPFTSVNFSMTGDSNGNFGFGQHRGYYPQGDEGYLHTPGELPNPRSFNEKLDTCVKPPPVPNIKEKICRPIRGYEGAGREWRVESLENKYCCITKRSGLNEEGKFYQSLKFQCKP